MANLSGFDATTIAPREDFSPLQSGEYRVQITESEMKDTRNNTGQYLECTYEVLDGDSKGRRLWSRHNIVNQNPKAQEIAQRELSAICHAVNILKPSDSQQLHYKPMIVRVELVPAGAGRDKPTNDIKAWKADGTPAAATPAAPTGGATSAPPWAARAA